MEIPINAEERNISRTFISGQIVALLEPAKRQDICSWMAENFHFPSDTSEPGLFNPKRAPYQIGPLQAMSPQSPAREIDLCFGAQTGKTNSEEGAMLYYSDSYPRPQAFAFSNDGELKSFVKTKFNPLVAANPLIKAKFGQGARSTGDTLNEKLYPGGFLKFISANTESAMRSYSVAVMIADEIDTYPANVGGNGDPLVQLIKRTNTFAETRKIIFSSTPANDYSLILQRLEMSTFRKYFVPCPCCHEKFTFELEYFHYSTNEAGLEVTDAWMECPHCHNLVRNRDKTWMLDPDNGAEWIKTNPDAPSDHEGFFLPTFYAPEGWLNWVQIAQEYHNALSQKDEAKRLNLLVAFYNTVLCRQYNELMDTPDARALMQRGSDSLHHRGIAPSWVNAITTGGDVQKNRIEVTVMGWGKRMRHIPIDHYIFELPQGEEITDLDGTIWVEYYQKILNGLWEREDGFVLRSVANALDRGYESRTIDNLYRRYQVPTFHPVRGVSDHKITSVVPIRKQTRAAREDTPSVYFDVPVDQIKNVVYRDLVKTDSEGVYSYMEFPDGYSDQFYDQLISEHLVINQKTNLPQWQKMEGHERNEVLDCVVYNYAMSYVAGLDTLIDEDWDALAEDQRRQVQSRNNNASIQMARQNRRRTISSGLS